MNHSSIFSGIGGAELAAQWVGWNNIFHCEINPFGKKVIGYWFPKSISYGDIKKTNFTEWRGRIDVLTGGFPCQPFSLAGKRNGNSDDRYLWPQMLRAIQEIQPTWVIGENVAGIVSMVEPGKEIRMENKKAIFEENIIYRKEQLYTIERICKDFEQNGYEVQPIIIPACAVGAPHRRERVWFIAHSKSDSQRKWKNKQEYFKEFKRTTDNSFSCKDGTITNTCIERLERRKEEGISKDKGERREKQSPGLFCKDWSDFPTQSPICCRNDGFSNRLDGITIPKWRAESIKAYGNAWVPQVAYEIFKAIELNEKTIKE